MNDWKEELVEAVHEVVFRRTPSPKTENFGDALWFSISALCAAYQGVHDSRPLAQDEIHRRTVVMTDAAVKAIREAYTAPPAEGAGEGDG